MLSRKPENPSNGKGLDCYNFIQKPSIIFPKDRDQGELIGRVNPTTFWFYFEDPSTKLLERIPLDRLSLVAEHGLEPKKIIIDKRNTEMSAIRTTFPSARLVLCQFHFAQIFLRLTDKRVR